MAPLVSSNPLSGNPIRHAGAGEHVSARDLTCGGERDFCRNSPVAQHYAVRDAVPMARETLLPGRAGANHLAADMANGDLLHDRLGRLSPGMLLDAQEEGAGSFAKGGKSVAI